MNVRIAFGLGLLAFALACSSGNGSTTTSTTTSAAGAGAAAGTTSSTGATTGENGPSGSTSGSTGSQAVGSTTSGSTGGAQGPTGSSTGGSTSSGGPGTTTATTSTTTTNGSTSGSTGGTTTGTACGAATEPCCGGSSCDSGLACQSGTCVQQRPSETGTPCTRNSDCQSGICYPVPGGSAVCTTPCSTASDCVPGWSCAALIGQPSNVCECTRSTEVCDGQDNDCDGIVDNEPAADQWCVQQDGVGQVCQSGACSCASVCGGTCVDTQRDPQNCGGCGHACTANGAVCSDGQCACPGDQTVCGSSCIDTATDPNNCGGCGAVCNGACSNGRCVEVVAYSANPTYLAVNGPNAYWIDHSQNTVMTAPVTGGSARVVATATIEMLSFATDGQNVYWTDGTQSISRSPVGGGGTVNLANGQLAESIALGSGELYWLDNVSASVRKMSTDGGPVTTLATVEPQNLAENDVGPVLVDAHDVYVSYFNDSNGNWIIATVPADGGVPFAIVDVGLYETPSMAIDTSNLYFNGRGLSEVPLGGGAPVQLASLQSGAVTFAVDSSDIYFITPLLDGGAAEAVYKLGLGVGATPAILASGLAVAPTANLGIYVQGTALDNAYVYWTCAYYLPDGGGAVLRVPKQ